MAQQTAVEWLAIQLYEKMNMSGDGKIFDELLEQAKQIEADNIVIAYETGWLNGDLKKSPSSGSDYYNETYNKL